MFDWLRRLCSRLYNVRRKKVTVGQPEPRMERPRDVQAKARGLESRAPRTRSRVQIPATPRSLEEAIREEWLPTPKQHRRQLPQRRRQPKTKAIHHDIGKFMPGSKHQHKWYRRSVKAKVQLEED